MVECERAKIRLSSVPDTQVQLNNFFGGKDLSVRITRVKFLELAKPILDRLKAPVEAALADVDYSVEDIDVVLLVGGSTRIPWVKDWLTDFFGQEPDDSLNPDEAVAIGATIMARELIGSAPA